MVPYVTKSLLKTQNANQKNFTELLINMQEMQMSQGLAKEEYLYL